MIYHTQEKTTNMEKLHILMVEDNEGDILLTKEALDESNILVNLSVVKDGRDALDFLTRQGVFAGAKLPDLLLLDVNLPKKNGHEVLKYIKEDTSLKHIPVIMLTTSSSQKDINQSYNNHVNCFITKPIDAEDYLSVVGKIGNFWMSVVKLPTNNH